MRSILKVRYLLATLLAMSAIMLTACGKKDVQAAGPGGAGARPPAPVVVAAVEQHDIPVQIRAIGNVESYQTVQLRSQVSGQIEKILFKEGDDVHKGQLLVQLDKRPFQADLEKAIGNLQRDEAQAANYNAQAERDSTLEKQGIVSREHADLTRAQAQAGTAAVYADKAAVASARLQLQYTSIAAPIDGRTGALLINVGNLVKANDTQFLVQLNQISPIYVTFSVPENQLSDVRRYYGGHLKVFAYPKEQSANPAEGNLTFIDNEVDTQTGTVKLKATFSNKDRRLWPGEFVDAVVNLSTRKNAILAPTKAIQSGQQGEYVYVVTPESTAEARLVQTAGAYQDQTIITAGLKAGERVITGGQLRVAPKAKVVVQNDGQGKGPSNEGIPAGGGL